MFVCNTTDAAASRADCCATDGNLSSMALFPDPAQMIWATGDTKGVIKLWDIRMDGVLASDTDDSSTSFFVNSRTRMGCTDRLRRGGSAHPISFPLGVRWHATSATLC